MLHPDSLLGKLMNRFLDFFLVNSLFLICSFPVLTAGTALSSLYAVIFRFRAGEEGVVHPFFREFRTSLKRTVIDSLVMAVVGAGILSAFVLCRRTGLTGSVWVNLVFGLAGFLYLSVLLWLFPIISQFEASPLQTLRNALLLSVCHFPVTLAMLLVRTALASIFLVLPREMLMTYTCFLVFFYASFTAWCDSCFLKGVFTKYQMVSIEPPGSGMI